MLYEKTGLGKAIEDQLLPSTLEELFGDLYDPENGRFLLQETTLIDFKETVPSTFTDSYGAGIVRLALGLHNAYGGVIVFGVVDRTLTPVHLAEIFNVEAFNRFLSDVTGERIECVLRRYPMKAGNQELVLQTLLVPRRGAARPVRLTRPVGKYLPGTLWIRDRHEVVEAAAEHLPLLYADRSALFRSAADLVTRIHRSLPTSPATMETFVGRDELMTRLWDWLCFSDQPRLYLHGPGGSGKSTLAYEFASSVADAQHPICQAAGASFDYVLYLSGKETAFNPLGLAEEAYTLRDFSNAAQQFAQILYHSGLASEAELATLKDEEVEARLTDLVRNFAGLIVIDDVDALSRRGEDTGEELLFLKTVQSGGKTKILYTSRYPPPYALRNAAEVPGLRFPDEFFPFVEACCKQFGVPAPAGAAPAILSEETDNLPLLIETVVALRRSCSSYDDAIRAYKEREGDAARRYLYQREYDRLDPRGKSRQLLAALSLMESAVSSTTIAHVASLSASQVADAITETKGIFLRTSETEGGDTLYDVTTSSAGFLRTASQALPSYPSLLKAVQHFKRQSTRATPEEAAIILRMTNLARQGRLLQIVEEAEALPQTDPVWGNPRFLGLVGRGYAELGLSHAEDAREYFRRAYALHDRDIFMLRSWYKMEIQSPNGVQAAEQLCRDIIRDESKVEPRYLAEFYSKLGQVLEIQSRSHLYTNRERAIDLLKAAISNYCEGAWLSRGVRQLDKSLQLEWLTDTVRRFFNAIGDDVSHVFDVIELWSAAKHDVDLGSAGTIMEPLRRAAHSAHPAAARLSGLSRRSLGKLTKLKGGLSAEPGFVYVLETLEEIASASR